MAKNTTNVANALSNILGTPVNQNQKSDVQQAAPVQPVTTPSPAPVVEAQPSKSEAERPNDPEAGFVRNTYLVRETFKKKMKIMNAKTGKPMKDLMDEALGEYIEKYEKKNGEISL